MSPSAITTAFIAPAEVPEMPSNASHGFLEQAVEHAPGERAVRAAALQAEIDRNGIAIHLRPPPPGLKGAWQRRPAGGRRRHASAFALRRANSSALIVPASSSAFAWAIWSAGDLPATSRI